MPRLDPFLYGLALAAGLGVLLPASGGTLHLLQTATMVVIAGLFFLYGARLSPAQTIEGLTAWKPQLAILLITFAAFPLMGVLVRAAGSGLLPASLLAGVVLLTLVPSTVQSQVAFTGIAGGDRALAVVSASVSNLLGVWLTPLLVAVTMGARAHVDSAAIIRIVGLLLVPFVLAQLARPVVGPIVEKYNPVLKYYDRASILLVVYSAFSAGTVAHVWNQLNWLTGPSLVVVCLGLLAAGFALTRLVARWFEWPVGVAITFGGTNKSIASGLPMATLLFSGAHEVALLVLPLMIYHFSQLVVCSFVATHWARSGGEQTPARR